MKWTNSKPTNPGYYWVRYPGTDAIIIKFNLHNPTYKGEARVQPEDGPLSTEGWKEFIGPLEQPK